MALTVYGLKPGTYSISVNDVVLKTFDVALKTFDVHQNIPFTIEIIDDNQVCLFVVCVCVFYSLLCSY